MKKLFSIFCSLLLSASLVTQAQVLKIDSLNISGRRNAVQDNAFVNAAEIPLSNVSFQNGSSQMIYSGTSNRRAHSSGNTIYWYAEIKFTPGANNRENNQIPTGTYLISNGYNSVVNGCVTSGYFSSYTQWSGTILKAGNRSSVKTDGANNLYAVYAAAYNTSDYVVVKRPYGNLYIYASLTSSGGTAFTISMGQDQPLTGEVYTLILRDNFTVNSRSSSFDFNGYTPSGNYAKVSVKKARNTSTEYSDKDFTFYDNGYKTYVTINNTEQHCDGAAGNVTYSDGNYYYDFVLIGYNRVSYYVRNYYLIDFDQQSGKDGTEQVKVIYNQNMPSATMPNRNGFVFGGYYDQPNGQGTQYYTSSGQSARTWDKSDAANFKLYAYWLPIYTITYKDQGNLDFSGTQTNAPTTHTYGTATTLPIPTKEGGYTFGGWYTSPDCTTGAVGNATSATLDATAYTGNITLYAKWIAPVIEGPTYTLNLNIVGNGAITIYDNERDAIVNFTDNQAFLASEDVIVSNVQPGIGYHLESLTLNGSPIGVNESFAGEPNNEYTVTAVFELSVYNISYKDKSNQTFSGVLGANTPTEHTYGTATALVSPTKENMTFGGWYENSACTGSAVTSIAATAKTADFTLYAKWRGIITATASGNGSVSGGGTYDAGTNASLTATPSNSNYYLSDWLRNGVSMGVRTNPLVVSVSANETYTAVFAAREVVNITADDELDLTTGSNYWSVAGTGTDGSSNYTMNIRFDASSLTGNFNSGVNTSNTWVQKTGGSQIIAQDISVATVTEPTIGNLHIVATIIGTDEKQYVITGNYTKPIVGSLAAFSFDDPNDEFNMGVWTDAPNACDAVWQPYGQKFVYLEVKNQTRTTDNYLWLVFKTNNSKSYNGYIAPIVGDYPMRTPNPWGFISELACNGGYGRYYWQYDDDATDVAVGFYEDNETQDRMGICPQSSYLRNYADGKESGTYSIFTNRLVRVSTGKGGYPFIQIINTSTNAVLVTIGAPAKPYTLAWDASGKSLTGGTAAGSVNEGTSITAPTSNTPGYTVSSWSPAFTGTMPSANTTYTAQWSTIPYNLTYDGLEGATNTNPTSYNVESETITLEAPGARDGYRFTGWTDNDNSNAAVTQIIGGTYGDRHFTANWEETSYTVKVAVDEAGHGTVTADKDKVDKGGSVTLTYTPDSYLNVNSESVAGFYEFVRWSDKNTENPRTIDPVNADINLKAVTRLKTTLTLRDDMPDDYYDDMAEAYYGNGTSPVTLTEVTCNRSFAANQWTVFSLPFGLDLDALENSQLDGKVYHYIGATGNADEGLNVNFEHETDEIIAGMPYLFYSPSVVKDPVFSNVTLNDALVDTDNDKQAGYTTGKTGDVRFIATNRIKSLQGGDKSVIFLSKSRLYYPNAAGNKLRPFRGFFKVPAEQQGVTPRLRIVANGQTVTEIEAVVEDGQQATVRKYIENGTLVIEREGVRYDATGAKIN